MEGFPIQEQYKLEVTGESGEWKLVTPPVEEWPLSPKEQIEKRLTDLEERILKLESIVLSIHNTGK